MEIVKVVRTRLAAEPGNLSVRKVEVRRPNVSLNKSTPFNIKKIK